MGEQNPHHMLSARDITFVEIQILATDDTDLGLFSDDLHFSPADVLGHHSPLESSFGLDCQSNIQT